MLIYIFSVYIYIHAQVFTTAKISTCVTKLLILILQITDVISKFKLQVLIDLISQITVNH